MSVHHHCDICIIGAGAIGKAAALGLSQAGLRVILLSPDAINTFASAEWDVRVFALNHIAHGLLASLKVWDAMDLERVTPIQGMQIFDVAQTVSGNLDLDAYSAQIENLAWIVEDRNLNQALDTALKFAQNLSIIQGRAQHFSVSEGAVLIQLEDATQISAALLVGADGAQSWVRGQCEIDYSYRSYGQRGVVTNFACEKPHKGVAHQWFVGEQGIIALLPLPGNRVSLVWSAPDALAAQLESGTTSELAAKLAPYCADALGTLTPLAPELIKSFALNLIRPHTLIADRVALIGDAAHAVHPLAGHGMNLGFGDIKDLITVITQREPHRDCGDARVLARYSRARKEQVLLMQVATDGLARLFGSELAPVRMLRDVGLNLLDRLPVLKRKLISHAMGK